ncbi:MAG: hypothetical protein ACM3PT_05780 [Deltaproteobacteria bacterium]
MLILSSFFLFNACNKDRELLNDSVVSLRSDAVAYNLNGLALEFFNWYNLQKPHVNFEDANYGFVPFTFEIDWSSGSMLNVYGYNSLAFNVLNNPTDSNLYIRNQILFVKNGNIIEIKTLSYVADEDFYNDLVLIPSIINFTGFVLESSGSQNLIDKIHRVFYGKLYKTIIPPPDLNLNPIVPKADNNKNLSMHLRGDPQPEECDDFFKRKTWLG